MLKQLINAINTYFILLHQSAQHWYTKVISGIKTIHGLLLDLKYSLLSIFSKLVQVVQIFLKYYTGSRRVAFFIQFVSLIIFLVSVPYWFLKLGALALTIGGILIDLFLNSDVNFFENSSAYQKMIKHLNIKQKHIITIHLRMNLRKLRIYLTAFNRYYNFSMLTLQFIIDLGPILFYWLICIELYGFLKCTIKWVIRYWVIYRNLKK